MLKQFVQPSVLRNIDSKENIVTTSVDSIPQQISSEEDCFHADDDSQSNCSDLKTPTAGSNMQYVTPGSVTSQMKKTLNNINALNHQ